MSDLEEKNQDLKKHLDEQRAQYEAIQNRVMESQQLEEKRHQVEVEALERSIQQLQVGLRGVVSSGEPAHD